MRTRGALALALAQVMTMTACGDAGDGDETDGGGTEGATTGASGDGSSSGEDTDAPPGACEGELGVTAPMRRMTGAQYRNTVVELFGGAVAPSDLFPAPDSSYQYSNNPEANVVTQLRAENIMLAAEEVGAAVADGLDGIWQCPPELASDAACAAAFIEEHGARAYRRPLEPVEADALLNVYSDARATLEHHVALGVVVATILQSPQFLYFIERGDGPTPEDGALLELTDWELATRLSYLLWDTAPDAALRASAAAGELQEPAQLEAHARRLLADPRARPAVSRFFREWLEVHELSPSAKDPALFPGFDQTLAAAMVEEFDRFVLGVALAPEGGTLAELLTSAVTEVDATMASFYGVPQDMTPGPGQWAAIELDPARRPGVLTRAAVLAEHANAATSSAIFRGHLVREGLLCDVIPPPPPGAMAMVSFPEGSTQREQSEILQEDPVCGSCHVYMNPIGLGLEHYDAIGRYRADENGAPVDASGEIQQSSSGLAATFDGAGELATLLAGAEATHACFVEQWHAHALGLDDRRDARCSVDGLTQTFLDAGGDLDAMMIAFVTSETFMTRRLPEVSP
ncbi:MAG: DUF1592 domain-containing protein [Myxococcales bacterium]|nr:DUF1592 domain-containing protein [Myxococcales bacterium]